MKTLIAALVAAVVLTGCAGEAKGPDASGLAPTDAASVGTSVAIGGDAAMSCVEAYDLRTVTNRAFAFDGTVREIGEAHTGDDLGYVDVIFEVREWFHGGEGAEVTVLMMAPGQVTLLENAGYAIDSRLLVSGEPR
ncbi:MAG: hypothetical protein GEU80_17640, partial [Dehalococcoidia bacterium]|nr:hypothetical protein [Dehalococcoidia bacterium]